jgi:hypothetical protein
MDKRIWVLALLLCCAASALAADTVLTWPSAGKEPALRFTIGKLRPINSYSGQTDYVGEATVENIGGKPIPFASFYLYLFDKNHKRIGEGYLELSSLGAGEQAKVALTAHAMGTVAGMELQAQHLPSDEPVKVKLNVISTPAGAFVKVDGQESGITPQLLSLAPGQHRLEFHKEGYASAGTPVDLAAGALPGSVNIELSPLTQDTVVLRNGTTVLGDVASVTPAVVTVTVNGKLSKYDRNQVARIIFVERKAVKKPAPTATRQRKK